MFNSWIDVSTLSKKLHEKLQKKSSTCSVLRSAAFVWKMRRPCTIYFCIIFLLGKHGTLCLESLIWRFAFLVRLIDGCWKVSISEVIVQKKAFCGVVLLFPFVVYLERGIVEFFKTIIILLILFGLSFNTQLLGGVWTTPNTFVITAFLWFSTIKRPLTFIFSREGSSCPLPLDCFFCSLDISVSYKQNESDFRKIRNHSKLIFEASSL